MQRILILMLFSSLFIFFVYAQDTGFAMGTGFSDDTGSYEQTISEQEVEYLLSEGRGDELTSDMIAEHIDIIDDITQLNSYEFNKYVQSYYGVDLFTEYAVSGARLTSDGALTNGEFGSKINLNDLSRAIVSCEEDGSISIYPDNKNGSPLDYGILLEENNYDDIDRPPFTVISAAGDYTFADGTILYKDSTLILVEEDVFYVNGVMKHNDVIVRSRSGPVLVFDQEKFDPASVKQILDKTNIQSAGRVILAQDTLFIADDALVILQENADYNVDSRQGMIFSSDTNSGILYDTSKGTPSLDMYGQTKVFNGLRLLEVNSKGQFYSFRGGWRQESGEFATAEEGKMYNKKLEELYGYLPTSTIPMDVQVYKPQAFDAPIESYQLRSGELHNALASQDLYVASYFLDDSFDKVPKEKAVILWSSGGEYKGDRSDFIKVAETKKQQLIAQGYAKEDIEVVEFKSQEDFFSTLDAQKDTTYLEVVSHGWVGRDGGNIGTDRYYNADDVDPEISKSYPITNREITTYLENREAKVATGKADALFSEAGAFCVISTCHSAATRSFYDPQKGFFLQIPTEEIGKTAAQAIESVEGEKVHVYGTVGPLYIVGQQVPKKGGGTTWIKTFIPVADSTAVFEGTEHPTSEQIYTQDIPYVEVGK